jgi:hypothetical protein
VWKELKGDSFFFEKKERGFGRVWILSLGRVNYLPGASPKASEFFEQFQAFS